MNVKLGIATVPGAVLGALVLAAAPAMAEHDDYGDRGSRGAVYAYAKVLSAEPIVRYVTVTTPQRECWEEQREYTIDRHAPGAGASTLVGAIIGGVIGHQFGSGRGNDAATAAGALIGAAVGNDSARRTRGYESETYSRPVRRCQTNYTSREEERIDGYHVTYRYRARSTRRACPTIRATSCVSGSTCAPRRSTATAGDRSRL